MHTTLGQADEAKAARPGCANLVAHSTFGIQGGYENAWENGFRRFHDRTGTVETRSAKEGKPGKRHGEQRPDRSEVRGSREPTATELRVHTDF